MASSAPKPGFNVSARSARRVNAPVDEAGHTLLHLSVLEGDLDGAARLLKMGADPAVRDAAGRPPMMAAISARNLDMISLLASAGGFAHEDSEGNTPLAWAVRQGADADFIARLIALGAPANLQGAKGESALHAAAASNNAAAVDFLLAAGADINLPGPEARTPLHAAIEKRSAVALRRLLEAGADPLQRDKKIMSPLYLAAVRGNKEAVDLLLQDESVRRTINEFRTYEGGFTPLMAAVIANQAEIAEKLIDAGAFVNQQDDRGRHSLAIAVENGYTDIARLLISRGADVAKAPTRFVNNESMLHNVSAARYGEIMQLLASAGADLDVVDGRGFTPLYLAANDYDVDRVKTLLALGADPNKVAPNGRRPIDAAIAPHASSHAPSLETVRALLAHKASPAMASVEDNDKVRQGPLHAAIDACHVDMVKLLLDNGADPNERNNFSGATPYLVAASIVHERIDGSLDKIRTLLLQRGADPELKDAAGRSLLHVSAYSGNETLLREGLAIAGLKAQLNATDSYGDTPLHDATKQGRTECIEMLLDAGADIYAANKNGYTPLHHAAQRPREEVLETYYAKLGDAINWNVIRPATRETPLHLASARGNADQIAWLIEKGADPSLLTSEGLLPLHAAVSAEKDAATTILIAATRQRNIDIDTRTKEGLTPLHMAARQRRGAEAVPALLAAGANINARDPQGNTPLHHALTEFRPEILRQLVAAGADLTAVNNEGITPLAAAEAIDDPEVLEILQTALREQQGPASSFRRPPSPPRGNGPGAPNLKP